MSLKLNASGGGSVTLQEPTTASNYTLNLPAVTATVLTDSAGVLNIGSGQVYKDAAGNVGIGTVSPSQKVEVYSSQTTDFDGLRVWSQPAASGTSYTYLNLEKGGGYGGAVAGYLQQGVGSGLAFFSNNGGVRSERARIDSSGNLLVGTSSTIGSAARVAVLCPSGTAGLNIQIGANGQNGVAFYNTSVTAVGSIAINATTTTYNTSSDYRLKDNVQPMTGALAKVAALKPCTYRWKADGSDGEGFIAHELQSVVPQCVTGEKDAVDSEGNPVYQGIDTSFLVATLTAAIQELKAEVDSLRAQVEAK